MIKPVLGFLRAILLGPETTEGFGQSMADDIRFVLRFRRCRRVEDRLDAALRRHGNVDITEPQF